MARLILACGSRTFENVQAITSALDEYPRTALVLHGAARGADRLAGTVAAAMGFQVEAMPADWDRYGRSAGYRRNVAMLDRGPDVVLAFWDGTSRGTRHTVGEAGRRGIPVRIVGP